jgi:hypothetical protein
LYMFLNQIWPQSACSQKTIGARHRTLILRQSLPFIQDSNWLLVSPRISSFSTIIWGSVVCACALFGLEAREYLASVFGFLLSMWNFRNWAMFPLSRPGLSVIDACHLRRAQVIP